MTCSKLDIYMLLCIWISGIYRGMTNTRKKNDLSLQNVPISIHVKGAYTDDLTLYYEIT